MSEKICPDCGERLVHWYEGKLIIDTLRTQFADALAEAERLGRSAKAWEAEANLQARNAADRAGEVQELRNRLEEVKDVG